METTEQVMNRINTDEDVLKDNGLTQDKFNKQCEGLPEDEVAFRFLKLLIKSLNQGWIADHKNHNQWKYEPRFIVASSGFRYYVFGGWLALSGVGSRLCLKDSSLAIHAGRKFTKWYEQLIIIK